MKKDKLKHQLLAHITEQEWYQLEQGDDTLHISGFNREILLRMRENGAAVYGDIPDDFAAGLYDALNGYLKEYMADCPEGHKWIILSCIYLACVAHIPMHPQSMVQWVRYAGEYYCPCHSGEGSVCRYCVCQKLEHSCGGALFDSKEK